MDKLKEKLYDMLYEIEGHIEKNYGKISDAELEKTHKITDTIKNIKKIDMLENNNYSEASEWSGEGRFYGNSYNKERMHSKQEGINRYSRTSAKEYMIHQLKEMLSSVETQKEKTAIEDCIQKIERA